MSSKKSPYMVGCILIPEAERSTTSSEFVPMGISIPWETVIVPLLTSALPPSLHPKRISATAKEPTANLYTEFIMVIFERYRWSRSEEHTSELQSRENLVCRLLLEKKNNNKHPE